MQRSFTFLLVLLMVLLPLVAHTPQAVVAQSCDDEAELVEQTFDPPGEIMAPDVEFTVTWKLRNVGDCTWSRAYRAIFISGDRLEGARTTRLRANVEPDETLTLTLELTAPSDVDTYSGTWRLRNSAGDTFGPELTVEIEVSEAVAAVTDATTDIVLPEVLVFGGMGSGDDENVLIYCVEDGKLPLVPKLVLDLDGLEYRYTTLFLCNLPEGMEVTVEITDPDGNTFRQDYIEDAEVTHYDEAGNEYTGTVLQVPLAWPSQAPAGAWEVTVTGDDYADAITIRVPPPLAWEGDTDFAMLDNWPVAPIDPLIAATSCHYGYLPGQEMMVSGQYLLPNADFLVGVYQDRLGLGYLVDQFPVHVDEEGEFVTPHTAWSEPGSYTLVLLQQLLPEGYTEDGAQYDPGFGGDTGFSCYSVILEEEPEIPLRLAFVAGQPGAADIEVIDMITGLGYYPTYTAGNCDASDPAWWPDGEWIIYQSTCYEQENDEGWMEVYAREDYDLYGSQIDYTYALPPEELLVRLTATPDIHETEPDANLDGLIIYRATPVGEMLDGVGELHLLDIFEETDTPLGLYGRAPTWSPDGTRIAFMSDLGDTDGTWQIYVYDFTTDALWLVSRGCATHCRLPAWSPDGKEIIYHQAVSLDDFAPSGMWIAPVRGIVRPRLFLEGEYGRPSWSSAGWIIFQGPNGIYRADPSTATADTPPTFHRYLYSDSEEVIFGAPVWSY